MKKQNVTDVKDISIETQLKLKDDVDIEKLIAYKTKEIKEFIKVIEEKIKTV